MQTLGRSWSDEWNQKTFIAHAQNLPPIQESGVSVFASDMETEKSCRVMALGRALYPILYVAAMMALMRGKCALRNTFSQQFQWGLTINRSWPCKIARLNKFPFSQLRSFSRSSILSFL
jgi:hypothetical protein